MALSFEPLPVPSVLPDNFLPVALPYALTPRSDQFLPVIEAATGAVLASVRADRLLSGDFELPVHDRAGLLFGPPMSQSGTRAASVPTAQREKTLQKAIIGVIDLGFAFWNPRFRSLPDSGFAGIAFLNFEPDAAGGGSALEPEELDGAALAQLVQLPGGEVAIRAELRAQFPRSIHGDGPLGGAPFWHGTAMAELAAPPNVPLFGLELPRAVLEDSTGGTLEAVIAPAIRTLVSMMMRHPLAGSDTQLLILAGFAFTGGPRDGSRPGVKALRAVLDDPAFGRVKLVLPMGNHGAEPCVLLDVEGPMVWTLPPDDHSANTLDLFPAGSPSALVLTEPGGAEVRLELGPEPRLAQVLSAGRLIGLIWSRPGSEGSARIRITLNGTAAGPAVVQPGSWTVALDGADSRTRTCDAWLLRDDRPLSDRREAPFRQAALHLAGAIPPVGRGQSGSGHARVGTASALASAQDGVGVVAVGALERAWPGGDARRANYSGRFSDGQRTEAAAMLVDAEGPGRGTLALGGGGARLYRVSGTSVAAALHVHALAGG